uniref:DM domain-containing protein n=1 Tax=Acrobeloides nanus TaxID=290746 RepID=A0A914EJC2_9BILA
MVDKRRELNSLLIKTKSDEDSINSIASNSNANDGMLEREVTKERMPRCQRCAQHNVHNRLKGHKRTCPFLDCHCIKCQVVLERQRLMADQIKLRRRQKKQKKAVIEQQQTPSAHEHMQLLPFVLPPLPLEFRNEQQGQHLNSSIPDMHSRKSWFHLIFDST